MARERPITIADFSHLKLITTKLTLILPASYNPLVHLISHCLMRQFKICLLSQISTYF